MSLFRRVVAAALGTALIGAVPALAQSNRALVIGIFGGGYTHVNNLNSISGQNADFRPGYNIGGTVGVKLNNIVSLHSDLTFARSQARGLTPFAGAEVDHLFYGVHAEVAYQMMAGLKGYAFGGGCARTRRICSLRAGSAIGHSTMSSTRPQSQRTKPMFSRCSGLFHWLRIMMRFP